MTKNIEKIAKTCGKITLVLVPAVLLFALYTYLPSTEPRIYASPDETSTAVVAQELRQNGRAFINEPRAVAFPWLHPRSWVSQGERLVPVGFLGWPCLLSLVFMTVTKTGGAWFTALIAVLSFFAFGKLLRRDYSNSAWLGAIVAFTFPAIILYANRGLFSNLPILAVAIFGSLTLDYLGRLSDRRHWKTWLGFGVMGLLVGFALTIRPVELVWILPWWIWFGRKIIWDRSRLLAAVIGGLIACLPVLWVAHQTYGGWFTVGYLLHDNPLANLAANATVNSGSSPSGFSSLFRFLPYGFHPRAILSNVTNFLFGLLWPWFTLIIIAAVVHVSRLRQRLIVEFRKHIPFWLAVWTMVVLLILYGSGRYTDNIQVGAVTIGNSFIRYMLPIAVLSGWSLVYLVDWLRHTFGKNRILRVTVIVIALVVTSSLAGFGIWRAYAADNESLFVTQSELERYDKLRRDLRDTFDADSVIFSDRSDKIFFPTVLAVSPLPSFDEMVRFVKTEKKRTGLYVRPLTQTELDQWRKAGINISRITSSNREMLYELSPINP